MCKKKMNGLLILLLLFEIFLVVFLGSKKAGFYIDEIYSYGLSNSYYAPFLRDIDNWRDNWQENDVFEDYLAVNKRDAFRFDSVFYNQSKDVNPPLFYCVIHLICSLSQGIFSKWQGLIVNLIFLIFTIVILYYIAIDIFENQWEALLIVAIYGLSAGTLSAALYIRMYMLLTLLCVCDGLVHAKLYDNNRKRKLLVLYLVTVTGFFVHYYFIIAAFFVSAVYSIIKIYHKQYKEFIHYALVRIGGILTAVLIYPTSITQIFFGYRGKEAFQNLSSITDFLLKLQEYLQIYEKQIIPKPCIILLILVCIVFVIKRYCLRPRKEIVNSCTGLSKKNIKIATFSCCAVLYSAVIAKIAPYCVDRYVFCIYPYWIITIYWIFKVMLSF